MTRGVRSLLLYGWLIAILLAAVVFSPDPGNSRAIGAAHDCAHAPVFGLVCIAILAMLKAWPRMQAIRLDWQYVLAICGASVLGLATEVAQAFAARDASWLDLRSDVLGAAAAAGIFAAFDDRVSRRPIAIAACVLGIAAFVAHSLPLIATARDYARRQSEFPVVLMGESIERNGFVSGVRAQTEQRDMPAQFARASDKQALHVRFDAGQWPSVHIDEPYPNWSGYRALALDVTNPGDEPLEITLRIHDRVHDQRFEDRFNRGFELPSRARTTLTIPLVEIERAPVGRRLDLTQVEGLVLFTSGENAGKELYVSRIELENDH